MNVSQIIRDEISNILESTKKVALQDGVVTNEELALIDLLGEQLDKINDEIQSVVDLLGDLSAEEVRSRIKIVSREIIPKMTELAKMDNEITHDERAILDKLEEIIVRQ